ncbi:MAG: dephospho-CoA kinase [Pseudomonadota bacterium]
MSWKLKQKCVRLSAQERLYQLSIPIIGLTGGIASGKSLTADFFRGQGLTIISADMLIKNIYQTTEAIEYLRREIPTAMDEAGSKINFSKLREIFFNDSFIRQKLEGFLYLRLPGAFHQELQQYPGQNVVIYDVPLLFEKNLQNGVDQTLCVYWSRAEQQKRLQQRDGTNVELINKILSCQWDIEEKKKLANWVIDNTGSKEDLKKECQKVFKTLFASC